MHLDLESVVNPILAENPDLGLGVNPNLEGHLSRRQRQELASPT
jgi:hypothetical protein